MTSQIGSSDSPARPGSAPAVRLAGKAVTSAILTYFGLIVTKGRAFAKGSCGSRLTRPGERPALGRATISGVPPRRKTAGLAGHEAAGRLAKGYDGGRCDRPVCGAPARMIRPLGGIRHGAALRPTRRRHLV